MILLLAGLLTIASCRQPTPRSDYLFVWAGDSAGKSSDFLAVLDANPASSQYGTAVASLPTGSVGAHPHHTEAELSATGHLLANGFHAGRTWLFDLTAPRQPRIITSFGDLAGYSHPHTYLRLSNGNVLATFQYKADSAAPAPVHGHGATPMAVEHATGGLVEMDERGTKVEIRSRKVTPGSATNSPVPASKLKMRSRRCVRMAAPPSFSAASP